MRDLLLRIWRYLSYPATTHGKVEEIWQRARKLSDSLPQVQKLVTDTENFKIKISAVESDLRYLKALMVAVQSQLNSIQDHLRSSQPWLPLQQSLLGNPECLLLAHLAGFLQDPFVLGIGPQDDIILDVLRDAGFKVYVSEPHPQVTAELRRQLGQNSKEIPADAGVLRITTGGFDAELVRQIGEVRPEIVEIVLTASERRSAEERLSDAMAPGEKVLHEMRARGYRWNLLLFEIKGEPAVRFAANLVRAPDAASGSFFLFKESRLFDEAYRWIQTVLPRFQHHAEMQNKPEPRIGANEH